MDKSTFRLLGFLLILLWVSVGILFGFLDKSDFALFFYIISSTLTIIIYELILKVRYKRLW